MASKEFTALRGYLATLPDQADYSIAENRAFYDRAEQAFEVATDIAVEPVEVAGRAGEWLRPPASRDGAAVLYLHGGGYVIGSIRSHRHLAADIARAAEAAVLVVDYRLAPEHPYPAAVDDAVAAYRWLLDRGHAAERIAVAGDSAGGGLTVTSLLAARDAGLPMPAAGVCLSPWTDLTLSGDSHVSRRTRDPLVKVADLRRFGAAYLGATEPTAPLASPVFADLAGLPPLLIQVGDDEVLLDDAVQLEARAKAAGVDATLEVWSEMIHVWHWFAQRVPGGLPEGREAIDRLGAYIKARSA